MDGCVPRPLPHPPVARQIKDVIRQLAREFGVPPSRIALTGGAAQRSKTFVISKPADLPSWLREMKLNF